MLDDAGWAISEIGGPIIRVDGTELILASLALLGRHTTDAVWVKVAVEMGGEAVGAVAFVEEPDGGAEEGEAGYSADGSADDGACVGRGGAGGGGGGGGRCKDSGGGGELLAI